MTKLILAITFANLIITMVCVVSVLVNLNRVNDNVTLMQEKLHQYYFATNYDLQRFQTTIIGKTPPSSFPMRIRSKP